MADVRMTFPTSEEAIRELRAGDSVTVDGHVIGIRDRTQMRIFDEGVAPPLDLTGAFLLHTAPNVRKVGPGDSRSSASARPRARAWRGSPSRSAASTACARSAARAVSPTR